MLNFYWLLSCPIWPVRLQVFVIGQVKFDSLDLINIVHALQVFHQYGAIRKKWKVMDYCATSRLMATNDFCKKRFGCYFWNIKIKRFEVWLRIFSVLFKTCSKKCFTSESSDSAIFVFARGVPVPREIHLSSQSPK